MSVFTLQVLAGVLLVCLGVLVGTSWTIQALQSRFRRQAEERRRLNAEWVAVRNARLRLYECPRCGRPLSEQDWYDTPPDVADQDDPPPR